MHSRLRNALQTTQIYSITVNQVQTSPVFRIDENHWTQVKKEPVREKTFWQYLLQVMLIKEFNGFFECTRRADLLSTYRLFLQSKEEKCCKLDANYKQTGFFAHANFASQVATSRWTWSTFVSRRKIDNKVSGEFCVLSVRESLMIVCSDTAISWRCVGISRILSNVKFNESPGVSVRLNLSILQLLSRVASMIVYDALTI